MSNSPIDNLSLKDLIASPIKHLRSARLPIFRVSDATISGYELLIRGPGKFSDPEHLFRSSSAEGLLSDIDRASLIVSLNMLDNIAAGLRVHINLFADTILSADMDQLVAQIRNSAPAGIAARKLCIEIIEMATMPQPEELLARARAIKSAGIELAIDDIGCGASSVEALVLLEPHVLKIDRRFVTGAFSDAEKARRYTRLVKIAKSLGCTIVAEGVDSESDRVFADEIGVDMGQGLLTGPLPQ